MTQYKVKIKINKTLRKVDANSEREAIEKALHQLGLPTELVDAAMMNFTVSDENDNRSQSINTNIGVNSGDVSQVIIGDNNVAIAHWG